MGFLSSQPRIASRFQQESSGRKVVFKNYFFFFPLLEVNNKSEIELEVN